MEWWNTGETYVNEIGNRVKVAGFFAEVLVIISGVLLALAADFFWERRQESQKEHQYLETLATELQAADSVLKFIIDFDSTRVARHAIAIRVLMSTEPPAPADSLWGQGLGVALEDASFVTGTTATLVQTGDINLMRPQVLRTQVGDLYSVLETHTPRLRFVEELLLQNFAHLVRLQLEGGQSLEAMRANADYVATTSLR